MREIKSHISPNITITLNPKNILIIQSNKPMVASKGRGWEKLDDYSYGKNLPPKEIKQRKD